MSARERPDSSRKRKPGKNNFWSLLDHPNPQAQREISKAVRRLREDIRDLSGVTVDPAGSGVIIQDCGPLEAGETPLGYDARTRTILINERCRFWENPRKHTRRMHDEGLYCTPRPDHLELHEVGHARHHFSAGDAYNGIRQSTWISSEQKWLVARLSLRAATRPVEFVSEAYVAFRTGVPLDPELFAALLSLYRALKGPAW
jgi:hypothetical protein